LEIFALSSYLLGKEIIYDAQPLGQDRRRGNGNHNLV